MTEAIAHGQLQAAIDHAAIGIMLCDRDLRITYANKSAMKLLRDYESEFATVIPGFDASKVFGMCVDDFYEDPVKLRRTLSDPRNLPCSTDVSAGRYTFAVTISATLDSNGEYAGNCLEWSDVTDVRLEMADYRGQISAIRKAQAVIEFNMEGTILDANENYLQTMGYTREEIVGKHHGIFVDEGYRNSAEYRHFWESLKAGNYQAAEYLRLGKGGKEVWIQATYNPIFDPLGRPFKVVKYATDITDQRKATSRAESMFSMIEGATANFMTCDLDLRVTYVNPSLMRLFQEREAEIRKAIPKFDVRNIIGMCIDDFHRNPAHQRRILSDPRNLPMKAELKIGSLLFEVTATALIDSRGKLLGSAAEWTDLNDRTTYSREVQELIEAGLDGDLRKRGNLEVLSDDYRPMMQGINDILDAVIAPITEAGEVLQRVGQCDLTARVTGEYKGDHAAIKDNLNRALESLENALGQAREASLQVNLASEQIAGSSQVLAEGASEQASSLEEVSASLEELTAMTGQNAENATQADLQAKESYAMARRGNEAMTEMEVAIQKIKVSSDQTAKIIKTIDEIAFQTNLLALNAAVEAARAGEAGKGFAVVAEEVRNLAARSAEAARNTADRIESSVKNAEEGVRISGTVATTLREIMESASRVSEFISEIAAASKEQAAGLSQINRAVSEMDKVTQANAAGAEESAAAAQELSAQAESLGAIIAGFRLSDSAGPGYGAGPGYSGAPAGYSMAGGPPQYGQQPPPWYTQGPPPWQPMAPWQRQQPPWPATHPAQPGAYANQAQYANRWNAAARSAHPASNNANANNANANSDRRPRRPEEVIPLDDNDLHEF